MISDLDAQRWDDLIAAAVRRKVSKFPDVDGEDLHQDLWVKLLAETQTYSPDQQGIRGLINRWATKAAWDIRKENLYNSAQYFYCPDDVRLILETAFHSHEWEEGYVPKDAQSITGETWTDASDLRSDIAAASKGLDKKYKIVLFRRYALKEYPDGDTQRKRLERAEERLTDLLNWYYRSQHYRRAMSNAAARATIEDQEES